MRREILAMIIAAAIIGAVGGAYLFIDIDRPTSPMVAPANSNSGADTPLHIQVPAGAAPQNDVREPSGNLTPRK